MCILLLTYMLVFRACFCLCLCLCLCLGCVCYVLVDAYVCVYKSVYVYALIYVCGSKHGSVYVYVRFMSRVFVSCVNVYVHVYKYVNVGAYV